MESKLSERELMAGNCLYYGLDEDSREIVRMSSADIVTFELLKARYSPIPLTEDILVAAGFEKHSNSNEFWSFWQLKNGWHICESHHDEESAGVKNGGFYFGEDYIEIPNLHWLQNFYFFNTKKELDIDLTLIKNKAL